MFIHLSTPVLTTLDCFNAVLGSNWHISNTVGEDLEICCRIYEPGVITPLEYDRYVRPDGSCYRYVQSDGLVLQAGDTVPADCHPTREEAWLPA